MYGICVSYAKNKDDAKDLLQDGFIKVFNNLKKYSGGGNLQGWIRRIIINNAIDAYRKKARYSHIRIDLLDIDIDSLNGTNYSSSENEALKTLGKEDFLKIIEDLPEGYKMILNLYIGENMTHEEIADKLGIKAGTSKSQYFKAKKYLKDRIHKYVSKLTISEYKK